MGPEDDYEQDAMNFTNRKAPTSKQLTAHGVNGTDSRKADRLHISVLYTERRGNSLVGDLAVTNPSEKIFMVHKPVI
jgi:hypothetical protein